MIRKSFDQSLYNQNDSKAREAAKKYWFNNGVNIIDNPDRYGPDLIFDDGSFLEVEVKHTWTDTFPFDTLQLPERKEKFAKLNCKFMVFNKTFTKAFLFDGDQVLQSDKKEVKNKFVPNGEMFFQIPISKIQLCEI